jgi:hypothetical protein
MVILSTMYNLLCGNSYGWNRELKHAEGGVV